MKSLTKQYIFHDKIGSGTTSRVYKLQHKRTKELFAAKIYKSPQKISLARHEHHVHSFLSTHPLMKSKVIPVHDYVEDPSGISAIVMEYASNGNLHSNLHSRTITSPIRLCTEIAEMLQILHSLDIMYSDLKPENLVLDNVNAIRLIDFGCTQTNIRQYTGSWRVCGTPYFMAPELLQYQVKEHGHNVDVYSFGVVCFWILTNGMYPYELIRSYDQHMSRITYKRVRNTHAFDKLNATYADFCNILTSCMNRNPCERPLMREVVDQLNRRH